MTRHAASGQRLIADRIYRALYRIGFRVARCWWRLRRPAHEGALVAVRTGRGKLLVVRQSYRPEWTLPGGGVRRGEAPGAAAARELAEELGLDADPDHLVPALEVTGDWDYRRERVHVFELHLPHEVLPRPDNREVVEARLVDWVALASLPLTPPAAAYAERGADGVTASRTMVARVASTSRVSNS